MKIDTFHKVRPYSKNAKKHPDKQLQLIAKSLREYGWRQPIVVDKDNVIIVGHGRWSAYEKYPEGISQPWVEQANDLTSDQVKGYRLMDNKTNESDWDMDLVIEELKELNGAGFNIDLTGFSKNLLIDQDLRDDAVPEDVPAKAKHGEIYQLGKHRLMCGDSTVLEDVLKLVDGKQMDMVFTDPPFNVDYSGRGKNTKNKIKGDNQTEEAFRDFLTKTFKNYAKIIKESGGMYVCYASRTHREFEDSLNAGDFEVRNQIIWVKLVASMGWGDYRWKHEPILYCHLKGSSVDFYGDRKQYTQWDEERSDEWILKMVKQQIEKEERGGSTVWRFGREFNYKHPTQKPVQMIMKGLLNSSQEDDIIADLFLGSGATLIACEKSNRACFGMEIDPHYVDVIIKRYEDYTSNKAKKI